MGAQVSSLNSLHKVSGVKSQILILTEDLKLWSINIPRNITYDGVCSHLSEAIQS